MKNILFAVFCLGVFVSYYFALKTRDAGVSVILGDPPGVTGRAPGNWSRTGPGDYLRYSWTVLPPSAAGKLPVYSGPGAPTLPRSGSGIKTVKAKKRAGGNDAVKKGTGVPAKAAEGKKPADRKKRVSKLRDPGEAMGGKIYTGLPAKAAALPQQKK